MKKLAIAALVLFALLGGAAAGAYLWWNSSVDDYAREPFGSSDEKVVEIAPGTRLKEAAAQLKEAGIISDEVRFAWVARRLHRDRQIKAGEYAFTGALLPEKILETIALGKVKLYHCTIAEGLRMDEIAPVLEACKYGAAAEFLSLARDEVFVHQAGIRAKTLEGYLFPDTYSFPKKPKPEAVLRKMINRFFEELKKAQARRPLEARLDAHEIATLASIIEKETGAPEERPRISCVFHNRLKKKMRLETDPTVIYAKILRYGSFDGNIKRDDLEFRHPYNTYTVRGLPPGPIANAGAAAVDAALHPAECDDLFFVACGGGTHKFCPDFRCHQRNVDRCLLGKP